MLAEVGVAGREDEVRHVAELVGEVRRGDVASASTVTSSEKGSPARNWTRSAPSAPTSRASLIRASRLPHSRQAGAALGRVVLVGELRVVLRDRLARRPVEGDLALPQEDRPLAEPLHRGGVVGDEEDRPAALLELEDLAEALALERLVADGEHLVQQQHVRLEVRGDREAEAHLHPRGVGAHRQVDELLQLGEGDDLVQVLADRRLLQPEDRPVQEDVLAPGELGLEAGAELEQRGDAAADGGAPAGRAEDPGDDPQERRLAGAVAPDEPDRLARLDREGDVLQRLHLACGDAAARDDELLQRPRRLRIDEEAARDALELETAWLHTSDGTTVRVSGP